MNYIPIGTVVTLIDREGQFEIIASTYQPVEVANGLTLPADGAEYCFKRVDGFMESNFEPYLNLPGALIAREGDY